MGKELAEHEGVVGLGVLAGDTNVLIHVESDYVLEAGRGETRDER